MRLDGENELQPDVLLRKEGGQSIVSEDDYIEGAPELIAEIAASSASYDLRDKLKVYQRNQVQEYIVWRVYDQDLDWFRLVEGKYIRLEANNKGIICSKIFPGLWLDKQALLTGDMAKVLAILQQGIARVSNE